MSLDTHVEGGSGTPEEVFDVDPPYVPGSSPTTCRPRRAGAVQKHEDRFLDRELSWLRLNQRVLELAEDRQLPLLERVRFAAIFTSNLDEFFMVRVAGLKRRIAAGLAVRAASGALPREVLEAIWTHAARAERAARAGCSATTWCPRCPQAGIELVRWADLDREEQKYCKKLFKDRVFPVLTPLAVDPAHPFPYISGLSLNLAVVIRNPKSDKQHFARVKVPQIFARFVPLGQRALRAARGRHRRAPQAALPRAWRSSRCTPSGSPATRTSRSRRTTPRTSWPRWRRSCCAASSVPPSGSRSRSR